MNINYVALSGNLTRDPEMRTTANGYALLNFSIAVNERIKRGDAYEDAPNFIDCTAFGNICDYLSKNLHKGMKVFVAGKLKQSTWQDSTGANRSKIGVTVERIDFTKIDGAQATVSANPPAQPLEVYDDIPF